MKEIKKFFDGCRLEIYDFGSEDVIAASGAFEVPDVDFSLPSQEDDVY